MKMLFVNHNIFDFVLDVEPTIFYFVRKLYWFYYVHRVHVDDDTKTRPSMLFKSKKKKERKKNNLINLNNSLTFDIFANEFF